MKKTQPIITSSVCYGCGQRNPLLALPGVRLTKCPGCGVVQPHLTKRLVAHFYNEDKVAIA